ncbi:MAG TPA: V-type ATPase subunit [Candidatus Acidoferrales bacterium]|nr:V-type ATPase subunit [Candidatus Acidoferrales bacterium]
MTRASSNDLDYLTTRLHARRSRMAEGERLEELCRLRTGPELGRAVLPGLEISGIADFQRHLVRHLAQEIFACLKHLETDEQEFIAWLLARYQIENAKILLRGCLNRLPLETLQPYLILSPASLGLDATALLAAKGVAEFARLLPPGAPSIRLQALLASQREPPPFLLEAALDAGYFHELLARNNRLPGGELEIVKPVVFQEINWFQFMLVTRGRFHFGLTADNLMPMGMLGGGELGEWFNGLLSAPDLAAAAKESVGVVLDALPAGQRANGDPAAAEVSAIESLAWHRFLRLANSAFRRSHNGVGAVAGYFGVRRMEIANLITLSEGIRLGVTERDIRERMIPRMGREVAHV